MAVARPENHQRAVMQGAKERGVRVVWRAVRNHR